MQRLLRQGYAAEAGEAVHRLRRQHVGHEGRISLRQGDAVGLAIVVDRAGCQQAQIALRCREQADVDAAGTGLSQVDIAGQRGDVECRGIGGQVGVIGAAGGLVAHTGRGQYDDRQIRQGIRVEDDIAAGTGERERPRIAGLRIRIEGVVATHGGDQRAVRRHQRQGRTVRDPLQRDIGTGGHAEHTITGCQGGIDLRAGRRHRVADQATGTDVCGFLAEGRISARGQRAARDDRGVAPVILEQAADDVAAGLDMKGPAALEHQVADRRFGGQQPAGGRNDRRDIDDIAAGAQRYIAAPQRTDALLELVEHHPPGRVLAGSGNGRGAPQPVRDELGTGRTANIVRGRDTETAAVRGIGNLAALEGEVARQRRRRELARVRCGQQ